MISIKRLSRREIPGDVWANRVAEAVEWAHNIKGGQGVRIDKGPDGPTVHFAQSVSADETLIPWTPFGATAAGEVSFVPGLIGGVFPKIGTTSINAKPPPVLEITDTGTVYFELDVTDGVIFQASAVMRNGPTTPADTSSKAYVTLHYVIRTVDVGTGDVSLEWAIGRRTPLDIYRADGLTRVRSAG